MPDSNIKDCICSFWTVCLLAAMYALPSNAANDNYEEDSLLNMVR